MSACRIVRACSSDVSRSSRTRSSSSSGKVGRSATSAMIGSASASRATGTCRLTADASNELAVERSRRGSRPRRRSRAPSRVPAPSSSIAAVRLGEPNLPARIAAAARLDHEVDLRDRHLVQLDDPDRQAVRERPLLDRRQLRTPASGPGCGGAVRSGRCCATDERPRPVRRTVRPRTQSEISRHSRFCSGSTTSSTAGRAAATATRRRLMSDADSAR